MSTLLFFSLFVAVFALLNLYVYRRFVKKLGVGKGIKRSAKLVLVLLFAAELLYAFSFRLDIMPGSLYYALSLAMALSFMLFITALAYDFFHILIHKTPLISRQKESLKAVLDVLMILLFVLYLVRGVVEGGREPELVTREVAIAGLPFEELVVIQLSDVHVGNAITKEFVEKTVATVNAQNPDLVVITGDLVDKRVEKVRDDLAPLAQLHSRFGTFFVYGNHEYFHGYEAIGAYLKQIGIRVLDDECVTVGEGEKRLELVGLRDKVGERLGFGIPDINKAFAECNASLPTIVLAHQPVMIEALAAYAPDLVLSGHTHGGQIFPFSYLVKLAQPYLAGLFDYNGRTQIYVSRGTGFWGPPIRVFAPSEISRLVLKPKKI